MICDRSKLAAYAGHASATCKINSK